jgi:endonuclease G
VRRSHSIILYALLCLLLLGTYYWIQEYSRPEAYLTSSPVSAEVDGLIKYGSPIPHRLVGPYAVLINRGYVSGYDSGIQDPLWVETRFFAVTDPTSAARPEQFSTDERIQPQYQVNTHLWTDSGYDRGHMAPNWGVSICYGRDAQVETFLLTNVIPQSPSLNRGLWETLEKIISNDYAQRFGQVWIICGPIFGQNPSTLQTGRVLIPESCYKIVLRVDQNGTPHALAFVMPQDLPMGHQQRDLLNYLTSISAIEAQTGITFFPEAPTFLRDKLEAETANRLW